MSFSIQFWSCAGSSWQAARHGWKDSVSLLNIFILIATSKTVFLIKQIFNLIFRVPTVLVGNKKDLHMER